MTSETLVRHVPLSQRGPDDGEPLLTREWLVTNGLGGYASGTVAGIATRRYHGLLIAALPAPLGRVVMLNHVAEAFRGVDGVLHAVGGDGAHPARLGEFRLEGGLPVWQYRVGDVVVEKQLLMPHRQNTVHLRYRLVSGAGPLTLELRPALHFRLHEAPVSENVGETYTLSVTGDRYEVRGPAALPTLRLFLVGHHAAFTVEGRRIDEVLYTVESSRGYDDRGSLWSPGQFDAELATGREATLIGSTEEWAVMLALTPDAARTAERERRRRLLAAAPAAARAGFAADLVLAADQFVITPNGRVEDAARARAAGDDVRTVIAGYHWFTDWGRDTMISLEGLTLATGRHVEAGYILRTFANSVRDGLIPNLFPEGQNRGLYHTADATCAARDSASASIPRTDSCARASRRCR
jgi:predicted glycogen debranching enzyme